jgi:hypothetical protein
MGRDSRYFMMIEENHNPGRTKERTQDRAEGVGGFVFRRTDEKFSGDEREEMS